MYIIHPYKNPKKTKNIMKRLIKPYAIVSCIACTFLLGVQFFCGTHVTISVLLETGVISLVASLIVMAVWFIVGYLICLPLVKLINEIFFAIR
jgi:hypothetical protein